MHTLTLSLPFSIEVSFGIDWGLILKILFAFSLASFMLLLALYVIQMGDLTDKSFVLNSYELQAEQLSGDNMTLHTEAVGHYSLQDIEQKINQFNFVRAGEVSYIPIYPEQLVSNVQ